VGPDLLGQGIVLADTKTASASLGRPLRLRSGTWGPRSTPSAYSPVHAEGSLRLVCYSSVMGEPATKERILKAVEDLPDDATLDEAIEKLCFLAKVERGIQQADAGKTISHDEVKERLLG